MLCNSCAEDRCTATLVDPEVVVVEDCRTATLVHLGVVVVDRPTAILADLEVVVAEGRPITTLVDPELVVGLLVLMAVEVGTMLMRGLTPLIRPSRPS